MFRLKQCLLILIFATYASSSDPETKKHHRTKRNMMISVHKLWTNKTIYYIIDKSLEQHTKLIEDQMKEYMRITDNCITFVNSKGIGNYLKITEGQGCFSNVGMVGGAQTFSLGPQCVDSGIILHELGHALGFYHEQSRSDRDEYVEIHHENMFPTERHAFRKMDEKENYLIDEYDEKSIMQYSPYAFSKNGKATITAKDPSMAIETVDHKTTISDSDLNRLKSLYSCPGSTRPPPVELEDLVCTFQSDNCVFYLPKSGAFRRMAEEGNYHLVAEGTGEMQIGTYAILLQQGKACISIRYKVESEETLSEHWIKVQKRNYFVTHGLQTWKTYGWKSKVFEIDPKDKFQVLIYLKTTPNEYAKVKYDDFQVSYGRCSG